MRRDPVLIQTRTDTPNELGEAVISWSDSYRSYAEVRPLAGAEHSLGQGGQTLAEVTYRATLRQDANTATTTAGMRMVWSSQFGDRTLYLAAVLVSSKPGEVDFLLQERPLP